MSFRVITRLVSNMLRISTIAPKLEPGAGVYPQTTTDEVLSRKSEQVGSLQSLHFAASDLCKFEQLR